MKLKITNENYKNEIQTLETISKKYPQFKFRLDFNALFSFEEVINFWNLCSDQLKSQIEYIEDPCIWNFKHWTQLCHNYGIPIGLDREINNLENSLLKNINNKNNNINEDSTLQRDKILFNTILVKVKETFLLNNKLFLPFDYIIYKPAIQNHKYDFILRVLLTLKSEVALDWVVTSYLDHTVGIRHALAVAQELLIEFESNKIFTSKKSLQKLSFCGLDTYNVYNFDSELSKCIDNESGIGFSSYLESLKWEKLDVPINKILEIYDLNSYSSLNENSNSDSETNLDLNLNFINQIAEKIGTQYLFLNPKFDSDLKNKIRNLLSNNEKLFTESLCWLTSSGSSSASDRHLKLIGLSINSLITSAKAVNQHLEVSKNDVWLNILPTFHVGGLSIFFRGAISNTTVVNCYDELQKWSPFEFCNKIKKFNVTLTSLVPTQIFDLIKNKLTPPSSLRAVIVGGGALDYELYTQALQMGWPLLPSYGMTEVCSQIATAELKSISEFKNQTKEVPLKILPHVKLKLFKNNQLCVSSQALMKGYFEITPEKDTWLALLDDQLTTQDQVQIIGDYLIPMGRVDEVIKILGENVNLSQLRAKFNDLYNSYILNFKNNNTNSTIQFNFALTTIKDTRMGNKLVLCLEQAPINSSLSNPPSINTSEELQIIIKIFEVFNKQVLPFEKIKNCILVTKIPRTDLNKIKYHQINFLNSHILF